MENLIGVPTAEKCPFDGGQIMSNSVGSRWCINLTCNYFIHRGRTVFRSEIDDMNAKYAHLIPEGESRGKHCRAR